MEAKIISNIKPAITIFTELKNIKKEQMIARTCRAEGRHKEAQEAILSASVKWSHDLVEKFGATINIEGYENIPDNGPVLIVSNHQSYVDIPAICYAFDKFQFGFVAKDILKKVPKYGQWTLDCAGLFLERDNPRQAIKTFKEMAEMMEQGYSFAIFPEGTRSHGKPMREFKKGALKTAFKMEVPIVPVTVVGTWKLFERQNYFKGDECKVIIHPMLETKGLNHSEQNELSERVYNIIRDELNKYEPQEIQNINE